MGGGLHCQECVNDLQRAQRYFAFCLLMIKELTQKSTLYMRVGVAHGMVLEVFY